MRIGHGVNDGCMHFGPCIYQHKIKRLLTLPLDLPTLPESCDLSLVSLLHIPCSHFGYIDIYIHNYIYFYVYTYIYIRICVFLHTFCKLQPPFDA